MWNSLPDYVIMSDTINTCKNRLDAHWKHKEIFLFYCRATYTGTGDQNYVFEYVKINECLLKMWTQAMPTSIFLNDDDDDDDKDGGSGYLGCQGSSNGFFEKAMYDWSSIDTMALNCLVFEKIAFLYLLATDKRTDVASGGLIMQLVNEQQTITCTSQAHQLWFPLYFRQLSSLASYI